MLELTPQNLLRMSDQGKDQQKLYLHDFKKITHRRAGPHYMGTKGIEQPFRKNIYHRWLAWAVPQMCYGDPVVTVETPHLGEQSEDAMLIELALNRWTVDNGFARFLRNGPCTDMQYNMSVCLVSSEPRAGERPIEGVGHDLHPNDPRFQSMKPAIPWSPKVYRVPQERYFEDQVAMFRDEVRFQGHDFARDLSDIEEEGEEGGWDLELISEYSSDSALEKLGRSGDTVFEAARKEVVLREIWIPEAKPTEEQLTDWGVDASPGPDKGFHGWVFTLLASSMSSDEMSTGERKTDDARVREAAAVGWARKPRPYYGSPKGPYVIGGVYTVPGQSLPLGPLQAVEEEIRQVNTDQNVATNMIRAYKRLSLILGAKPQDVQILKDGMHDNIYTCSSITDKEQVLQLEIGGLTEQVMAHVENSSRLVDEALGMSEVMSGAAPRPGATATADALAQNAANARFAGIETAFYEMVEDIYDRVGELMWMDNRIAMVLGPEAAEKLGLEDVDTPVTFLGGNRAEPGAPMERPPYDALSTKIQAYSMRRTTEDLQQKRAVETMEIVTALIPMHAQFPDFPMAEFADQIGQMINLPGLGKWFAGEITDIQAQAPPPSNPLVPQPSNGSGVGLPGNQTGGQLAAATRT